MIITATGLIILLCVSHSFEREIPRVEDRNRPYIPIPSPDEVWRDPFSVKSPFYRSDNDYDVVAFPKTLENADSQESEEAEDGKNNVEIDAANAKADSGYEQNDLDKDVTEDKNDEENTSLDDKEYKKDQDIDDEGDKQNERKNVHGNNVMPLFFDREEFLRNRFLMLEKWADYLKELKSTLKQVFRQTMEEAAFLNGTYANTTEENVDVDGQKFLVQKSVIKSGDNNSSIFIEAVDILPQSESKRTKRSNWYAEKAQKAEESEP